MAGTTRPRGASAADPPASVNPFLSPPTRPRRPKETRAPSVTPRRFRRFFFTPQALPPGEPSRTALGVMTAAAANRQRLSPQSLAGGDHGPDADPVCPSSPSERVAAVDDDKRKRDAPPATAASKRRRGMPADQAPSLPPFLPPANSLADMVDERGTLGERRKATLSHFFKASRRGVPSLRPKPLASAEHADNGSVVPLQGYQPRPVRKLRSRGCELHLLDREHGALRHPGKQCLGMPASDPRAETAAFYSDSADAYHCTPLDGHGTSIPFSLASCHTLSLTAIGDEQGHVRFFNTGTLDGHGDRVTSSVKVHDNAVMDLDLSRDDCRLASACGDRSGRILDTHTQTVAVELGGGHWDSLRQVAFQPGGANGSVLATSDRASRVQLWDLRCSALPALCFSAGGPLRWTRRDTRLAVAPARTVKTIDNAHERTVQGTTSSASVTALRWLPPGREHLVLTASEANASIKLWDTRYIKPRRQAGETPVAATPEPASHAWRAYGITSMALSTDASRLYAVCKDSTVYAYSTHHLMLGHAPELLPGAPKRRPAAAEGLGPLYGLKHDELRVSSFYVKCAIRPSAGGGGEMLAVGSSSGCAVVFPTDERYMRAAWARREHVLARAAAAPSPPPSTPSSASSAVSLVRSGTPLVRGHSREVTTLSWSHDGQLVTASDDYIVRRWHEDAARARHLRRVGEFGGERYLAGWAHVGDDWDCDEW